MKFRKYVSAPGLLEVLRGGYGKVKDWRAAGNVIYPVPDVLMAATAMFNLKYPSLLQFDDDSKREDTRCQNLRNVFRLKAIPSDTQMRAIIDGLDPDQIHRVLKAVFSYLQQGKVLDAYRYIDEACLVAGDGTGLFSSSKVACSSCCKKSLRSGETNYYHQGFSLAIVHPKLSQVLPICLDTISNDDGATKNDCEMNAAKRALTKLRKEHPHLAMRLVLDGLYGKAPLIRLARQLDLGFIIVAKADDHRSLVEHLSVAKEVGDAAFENIRETTGKKTFDHEFWFCNDVPLNDANPDLLVNVLEYTETVDGKKTKWIWITDVRLTKGNVYAVMRGGRARWRIENETFNVLKNHGYGFEHNFGHGKKNLCTNFYYVMMTAFLIDQVQELSCKVFARLLQLANRRKYLWEQMRSIFRVIVCTSFEDYYLRLGQSLDAAFVIDTG